MKNLIFLILFLLCLFTGLNQTAMSTDLDVKPVHSEICNDDIILIEYIQIDDQWYQITYYSDGRIDVTPVALPPLR